VTARSTLPPANLPAGVTVYGSFRAGYETILSREALSFLADLARAFAPRIAHLLEAREERQARLLAGEKINFLDETSAIRASDFKVAPVAPGLADRRVEITGPVDRKMVINALNSGANTFMADFEDSTAPTWDNLVGGQINLYDAVRRTITFEAKRPGKPDKHYTLSDSPATLLVRPRGLHLPECHIAVDGKTIPGALFDFGLFFFHNAKELIARGRGPYFYLPKLESHREARLWNDVFVFAQSSLGIPNGTIRATVLIETLTAAFEMDEILYELRDHSSGLNCGRWDYIFSFIKKLQNDATKILPDRAQVGMDRAFLRAYSLLLIQTCHRRGAHAMGGMAAQIPIKNDDAANERALSRVRADKLREVQDGHDGTWVAHPGLVGLAKDIFDAHMKGENQLDRPISTDTITAEQLLSVHEGTRTEAGLRHNVRIAVQYLEAWLSGSGCVPLYNLMEDAATAEISRAQVWQWLRHGASLESGEQVTEELVRRIITDEVKQVLAELPPERVAQGRFAQATQLFTDLSIDKTFAEFLTLPAYDLLVENERSLAQAPPEQALISRCYAASFPPNDLSSAIDHGEFFMTASQNGARIPPDRFAGITRPYTQADVQRLRGSVKIAHTIADLGARRLWELVNSRDYVPALGAFTGNQAVQMVRGGLEAIYVSGWQVAADANTAGAMYPDQSLYPVDSVPNVVRRINAALQRADQIDHAEGKKDKNFWVPLVADAEAGFGGPLNAFELMKHMIEAGAAGVHFEDQLASEKKCGHMGGKVLVPTSQFIRTLVAARLAADVMDVPTLVIARTDADSAKLITSDVDERDHPFIEKGSRTAEGFFRIKSGIETATARAIAYAPYADLLWCETSTPDLKQAQQFAEGVHKKYPGKLLAYNCSPSFNWKKNLDDATIAKFQRELGAMGYKFQFVTLAGFHANAYALFDLANRYKDGGMAAYSELQQQEFAAESRGYSATKHQREVGTGYFDQVSEVITGGKSSTLALHDSTEAHQF
jgi:malate synthase